MSKIKRKFKIIVLTEVIIMEVSISFLWLNILWLCPFCAFKKYYINYCIDYILLNEVRGWGNRFDIWLTDLQILLYLLLSNEVTRTEAGNTLKCQCIILFSPDLRDLRLSLI